MCDNCLSIQGHCTTGPCAGDDYDILTNKLHSPGAANPAAAAGFRFNQSSSWSAIGNHTLQGNIPLPGTATGLFGVDFVAAGPNPGAALASTRASTVAGVAAEPYYLGLLGLRPSNSSRFDSSSPSFLSILKDQNLIPSLSFGYTAGAAYRSQGILGSLILGGYDRSKFTKSTVSFEINQDDSYALHAQVQSITASGTLVGDVEVLSNNITATIDSDLPYLYLPDSACKRFEKAFGLFWDASRELYLLNDTTHGKLRTSNPSIVFSFGQSKTGAVNITLPYQAFDLQVTRPIAENGTNHFPLRCSSNSSQYVLGRAFLQETYLLVDYEMSNFAISQAQFNNQSEIVSIDHAIVDHGSNPNLESSSGSGLSPVAIAGIAIGCSVALILLLSFLFYLWRRTRHRGQGDIRNRASISGPMPFGSTKDPWPNSPTSSGDQNTCPPMTVISNESSFQNFEERFERLERANTTTELPEDSTLRSPTSGEDLFSHWPSITANRTSERPKQELAGSPAARELQEACLIGRDQIEPARHVFELAAGNSRRTSWKELNGFIVRR
ncbi:MAG: hypothetical protein Q9166_000027 [cf. Caloplaca sp. 2 TL-2023]